MIPGIGIIGTGMVGQMCHLANFTSTPACRVVGIADLRPDLAAAAAAKFGISRVYRSHRELLDDPDVSAVVVVTRRRATGPIVQEAFNRGRHVLSEKPMAYTIAQASTLVNAARAQGLLYAVGYMKRHDAGVARAMAVMSKFRADASLGHVVHARAWCFAGNTGGARDNFVMTTEARPDGLELWQDGPDWLPAAMRPGYDAFLNVYSHIINLVRFMLGASPTLVESRVAMDGTGTFTLNFGGVPCGFELGNASSGAWREGIEITYEQGVVRIELPPPFAEEEARVFVETAGRRSELPRESSWAFRRQAQAFVADMTGCGHPLASGEDSVNDIALAEAIWKAHIAP